MVERDAYECEREATRLRMAGTASEVVYERCMKARGYVRSGGPADPTALR